MISGVVFDRPHAVPDLVSIIFSTVKFTASSVKLLLLKQNHTVGWSCRLHLVRNVLVLMCKTVSLGSTVVARACLFSSALSG